MDNDLHFHTDICSGTINVDKNDLTITGKIHTQSQDGILNFIAASPPDYHSSYSGSGLPFSSKEQAFENTPNKGNVTLSNRQFIIHLIYPNAYMIGLGSITIPPTVYISFKLENGEVQRAHVQVSEGIPYRSLTYPLGGGCGRRNANFYNNHWCLPIRKNQEELIRQSSYPKKNIMPDNFWGMKPSL